MLESDVDRLAMIEACDGVSVLAPTGVFVAIFESTYQGALDEPQMEGYAPALTCRTSDVERLGLAKGQALTVGAMNYRIVRHQPDGTGMSILRLKL